MAGVSDGSSSSTVSTDSGELDWRIPRSSKPWEKYFELSCPEGNLNHQPHANPWWSGESVFALEGQRYRQPSGPFYHAVFDEPESEEELLKVGEYLLSPAERRVVVPRLQGRLEADGCISYSYYDVHGVYITNNRGLVRGMSYYEVDPEGRLWPDPERDIRDSWCCSRARVIGVHRASELDRLVSSSEA